ncbi:MAG: ABC transporter ATP-binding protein [Alphaproteobacteria bacterium]|nr:ABC transporter ATP-binding protein [Alphaproteobacteria bacterium]
MTALLSADDVSVAYRDGARWLQAVDRVSFALPPKARLAIMGESGSGKTTLALAIADLLPHDGIRRSGAVRWPALGGAARPGRDVGFVFQDPMSSLNPVLSVGEQIAEVAVTHLGLSWPAALDRAAELLDRVGLPRPRDRLTSFPHELSGGQRQRVALAMAITAEPKLLIADEPTSALDTLTQAQIVHLLDRLATEIGLALVLVTHDLALAANLAGTGMLMYAGRVAELGPIETMVSAPRHPYLQALVAASLDPDRPPTDRLAEIPGIPPQPGAAIPGCAFEPRCPRARSACRSRPPGWAGTPADGVDCIQFDQLAAVHR